MESLRVCYLLCYKAPDYTRTGALLNALEQLADGESSDSAPEISVDRLINRYRGILRYPEMLLRLLRYRLSKRPDVWLLGFRGHECFLLFYPFMRGRRIVFDEFVIMESWIGESEARSKRAQPYLWLVRRYMRWLTDRCDVVLEDSVAHARLAQSLYGHQAGKYVPVPVGADETLFKPQQPETTHNLDSAGKEHNHSKPLRVFFYGTMLPLHGLDILLEAIAVSLERHPGQVEFELVGGKGNPATEFQIRETIAGLNVEKAITYIPWVEYQSLPGHIARADLCLGGPFGATAQSSAVITGKTYQFLAMAKATVVAPIEEADFFADRTNVLFCSRGSSDSLASVISWALQNRNELPAIGGRGRELFESRFSTRSIASQLLPVLRQPPSPTD